VLVATRNPSANRSLIAFTAWSSFAHAAVMVVMAVHVTSAREGLLMVSALLGVIGVALIVLAPAKPPGERGIRTCLGSWWRTTCCDQAWLLKKPPLWEKLSQPRDRKCPPKSRNVVYRAS